MGVWEVTDASQRHYRWTKYALITATLALMEGCGRLHFHLEYLTSDRVKAMLSERCDHPRKKIVIFVIEMEYFI